MPERPACFGGSGGPVEGQMTQNGVTWKVSRDRDLRKHQQEEHGETNARSYCGTAMKYSGTLLEHLSELARSADFGNAETVNNLYEPDYNML